MHQHHCKIIWLSLFARQKPFRDYFFLPLQQQAMQRNAKSNVISLWEVKQYALTSLQNYLTLFICKTETCPWLFFPLTSTTSHATPNVSKIATSYFMATHTVPDYFSTRCQIPPCHNIHIFQLHQNLSLLFTTVSCLLFTVYYCLLLWPLVHRAIFSTFFR